VRSHGRNVGVEDIAQRLGDLVGGLAGGEGGGVDLFEGVAEVGRMEGDQRRAVGGGLAGVEGGVPLPVLVAEADDDDVGAGEGRAGSDGVEFGGGVVVPEGVGFGAEDGGAAVVGGVVVCDRAQEGDGEVGAGSGDVVAPG